MHVKRAIASALILATAMAALLAVAAPEAQAATTCKVAKAPGGTSSHKYCLAPATDWPNYKGSVGYTKHHCGFYPFSPGACTMIYMLVPAWLYVGGSDIWYRQDIGEGTNVYVYPRNKDWRWVCVWDRFARECGSWHTMRATDIMLYWRA